MPRSAGRKTISWASRRTSSSAISSRPVAAFTGMQRLISSRRKGTRCPKWGRNQRHPLSNSASRWARGWTRSNVGAACGRPRRVSKNTAALRSDSGAPRLVEVSDLRSGSSDVSEENLEIQLEWRASGIRLPHNAVGQDLWPVVLGRPALDQPAGDIHDPVLRHALLLVER